VSLDDRISAYASSLMPKLRLIPKVKREENTHSKARDLFCATHNISLAFSILAMATALKRVPEDTMSGIAPRTKAVCTTLRLKSKMQF
jgi:hypothetical protein